MDIRNIVYACHQLHIMCLLLDQEALLIHIELNERNIAYDLVCSIFIEMFKPLAIFLGDEEQPSEITTLNVDVAMAILVNKSSFDINKLDNLVTHVGKVQNHSTFIFALMSRLNQSIKPKFLCPTCQSYRKST